MYTKCYSQHLIRNIKHIDGFQTTHTPVESTLTIQNMEENELMKTQLDTSQEITRPIEEEVTIITPDSDALKVSTYLCTYKCQISQVQISSN